jgi:hypothetical protein
MATIVNQAEWDCDFPKLMSAPAPSRQSPTRKFNLILDDPPHDGAIPASMGANIRGGFARASALVMHVRPFSGAVANP